MQAEEILAQARSGAYPSNWTVFPILRKKLQWGIAGWAFGTIIGLGLFALVLPIVIPDNFQRGPILIIFTLLMLGMFLFIGLGSLWTLVVDIKRLFTSDKHIFVFTPENFVKQEGNKVIQVPMENVEHITARGVRSASRTISEDEQVTVRSLPTMGENIAGFFVGRGATRSGRQWQNKRTRTPVSLAFLNTENDKQVIVVRDEAYGNPEEIGEILKEYAGRRHTNVAQHQASSISQGE
ncbi:hypothetical protein KSD_33070 [Ktedonobacter sp. SOSP1-85]|uniref:hypothetical protein n=1 Tax=Ktedonobacter sp. SOSP1-85 TaxID=2778367 RepID=UPI001915A8F3|nr:hypothetical protein [Ktedonobacter sp. SOSP1-85]GHO75536.1 hypothetical protein KSD_33070 [Ktedonobacter sp. SOSP1-85]